MIEDVSRRIDVGPSVGGDLHLGVVSERAVLHARGEPEEVAEAVGGLPRRHLRVVPVADVDDAAASVHLAAHGDEIIGGSGGGPRLIEPVRGRIRRVGRRRGSSEEHVRESAS